MLKLRINAYRSLTPCRLVRCIILGCNLSVASVTLTQYCISLAVCVRQFLTVDSMLSPLCKSFLVVETELYSMYLDCI